MSNKRGLEAGELHPPHKKQISNHDVFYANAGNSSESSDFSSIHDDNDGNGGNYDELSSLLQNLEMAPVLGNTSDDMENGSSGHRQNQNGSTSTVIEKEEIGDELQQKAISLAMDGENLFLTGKAGTGKSWTTKRIVKGFQSKNEIIHVTAPTGIAAINVDGQTIHSWGRFNLGEYYEHFDSMMSKETSKKIRNTNALLIDEISMLDGQLFDVLECMIAIIRCYGEVSDRLKIYRETAGSDSVMSPYLLEMRWDNESGLGDIPPWGGMQLIVVGDFYQLPPVPKQFEVLMVNEELTEKDYKLKIGRQGCYAFESHAWRRSEFHTVELEVVHRQAGNDGLFELLNAMREGETDIVTKHGAALSSMLRPIRDRDDGIIPTELHSTNRVVDDRNKNELGKLSGELHEFESRDEVTFSEEYKSKLLKKLGLDEISWMPYLFAFVETPPTPPPLIRARIEMDALDKERKKLFENDDDEDFESLRINKEKRSALKKKITDMEEEHRNNVTITPSSIKSFLDLYKQDGNATELFQKYLLLQHKVKSDFQVLQKFAQDTFFEKGCRVGYHIEMKKKAQVMLLYNLDVKSKLANGSRGVLEGFMPTMGYLNLLQREKKERSKNNENGGQHQNVEPGPLCTPESDDLRSLGPSDTKSSAVKPVSSEEANKEDDVEDFDFSSVDQDVLDVTRSNIQRMDMDMLEWELRDMERIVDSNIHNLPVVHFACGANRLIRPRSFAKEFKGCGNATRWQIPLTLAWAISIHKSQGMTIEWLKADLVDCFAEGQAYVACSRGKSLDSMYVQNFKPQIVKTSKKVKKFYSSLKPGGEPYTGTWSDTIDAFDREIAGRIDTRKKLEEEYKNTPCQKCGWTLIIKQVQTDTNHNRGKWYVRCPAVYRDGHTFIFLNDNPKQQCRANHTTKANSFTNLKPGAGGAIAGVLQGMRFVLTGMFPEIGGGVGLEIGKEKLKEIIRSFGGNVTGSISGKTDFLLIGEEPGEKKIQEAKAREITSMNLSQLHQILLGKTDLP